jgi:two-component system, OmpR family, KDP operon response regulator KdpE
MSAPVGSHILIVDDEPAIRRTVRTNLTGHGYSVREAGTGGEALEEHAARRPDLILLDLGLPDMDGLDVIREVRAMAETPIIVLSVRDAEREKVAALDLGADDYLTKPFGADELLARIRVALRHAARPADPESTLLRTRDLAVDLDRRLVTVGGQEIHLTPTEYELLTTLLRNPNRVLTDQMLLRQVWGPAYGTEAHYLHVYVARLRKKLEPDPQQPRYIKTEPGVGYRLLMPDE